jgi:ubiquinol-cytochrome c reductase cytochrome b subunit
MNRRRGNRAGGFLTWIDARFPLSRLWRDHASEYYAPKNSNIWYYGGGILLVVLGLQLQAGILLPMNYKPSARVWPGRHGDPYDIYGLCVGT